MSAPVSTPRPNGNPQTTPSGITPLRRSINTPGLWVVLVLILTIWVEAFRNRMDPALAGAITGTLALGRELLRNQKVVGHAKAQAQALASANTGAQPGLCGKEAESFPELYEPCLRLAGHDGPCAHASREKLTISAAELAKRAVLLCVAALLLSGCSALESVSFGGGKSAQGALYGEATWKLRGPHSLAK